MFSLALGIGGTLLSSGRTALFYCFAAGMFFAVVRRRFLLAVPVIVIAAIAAAFITFKPDALYSLPDSAQRALTPLNFSEQKTQVQEDVGESDRWHKELRDDSIPYWMEDTNSFYLGHGFKSWDDSIVIGEGNNVDFETIKRFAIEMGATENMFSSITNIFGLTGLVLYGGFLIQLAWFLWKGRRLSPPGKHRTGNV